MTALLRSADPDAAVCARLCLACLSGSALMHPLVAAWLGKSLPLMGEWIQQTYGTRQKDEARA